MLGTAQTTSVLRGRGCARLENHVVADAGTSVSALCFPVPAAAFPSLALGVWEPGQA